MPRGRDVRNDRRLVFALGTLCLVLAVLAGCNSPKSNTNTPKKEPTPIPTARVIVAHPAGFTSYQNADFHLAYPAGWQQQNPPNGTGVQYMGPTKQEFIAATLGNTQKSPEVFDAAFCSPTGSGGTPEGAAKVVDFGGESWMQQQCVDAKAGTSTIVESTVHAQNFYYIAYSSPTASFQANMTQYFTPMEQSFKFV